MGMNRSMTLEGTLADAARTHMKKRGRNVRRPLP